MDVWKQDGGISLLEAQQPLWGVLMGPEVVGQGRSSWKWVHLFQSKEILVVKAKDCECCSYLPLRRVMEKPAAAAALHAPLPHSAAERRGCHWQLLQAQVQGLWALVQLCRSCSLTAAVLPAQAVLQPHAEMQGVCFADLLLMSSVLCFPGNWSCLYAIFLPLGKRVLGVGLN